MLLGVALELIAARGVALVAHEYSHSITARALGWRNAKITVPLLAVLGLDGLAAFVPRASASTDVPGLSRGSLASAMVRHAGWIFSVALATLSLLAGGAVCSLAVRLAFSWTAADAVTSDLLGWCESTKTGPPGASRYFCGNFGVLLLRKLPKQQVVKLLRGLVQVTMLRGAQSAGIATWHLDAKRRPALIGTKRRGVRVRVVNGKRTDLSELLIAKCERSGLFDGIHAQQIFQGHTRFATSSIANLDGCHPHQWCPPTSVPVWSWSASEGCFSSRVQTCESFITHNGDLDFFELEGKTYSLEDLQCILPALLHAPLPATVDSICVAGLLDLLRTKGMWLASLRLGYAAGALSGLAKHSSDGEKSGA